MLFVSGFICSRLCLSTATMFLHALVSYLTWPLCSIWVVWILCKRSFFLLMDMWSSLQLETISDMVFMNLFTFFGIQGHTSSFLICKVSATERGKNRVRQLLVHCPSDQQWPGLDWVETMSHAALSRSTTWISAVQVLGPSSIALSRPLSGSWIGNRAAWTRTRIHMECWWHMLYSLCYNISLSVF